jgi:hypothetical protein
LGAKRLADLELLTYRIKVRAHLLTRSLGIALPKHGK